MENIQYNMNSQGNDFVKMLILKMSKEMNIVAVFNIIFGAITCISIVGAIFGIPIIIAGMKLKDSAQYYSNFVYSNDFNVLIQAFGLQQKYFNIQKILFIIYSVFIVLYLALIVLIVVLRFSSPNYLDFDKSL